MTIMTPKVRDLIFTKREEAKSYAQIQLIVKQKFGVEISKDTVGQECRTYGIESPLRPFKPTKRNGLGVMVGGKFRRFFTEEEDKKIILLRRQGLEIAEIAKTVDRPWASIRNRLVSLTCRGDQS